MAVKGQIENEKQSKRCNIKIKCRYCMEKMPLFSFIPENMLALRVTYKPEPSSDLDLNLADLRKTLKIRQNPNFVRFLILVLKIYM